MSVEAPLYPHEIKALLEDWKKHGYILEYLLRENEIGIVFPDGETTIKVSFISSSSAIVHIDTAKTHLEITLGKLNLQISLSSVSEGKTGRIEIIGEPLDFAYAYANPVKITISPHAISVSVREKVIYYIPPRA